MLPSEAEYFSQYGLTEEKLSLANPDAIVMHPGPINRDLELRRRIRVGLFCMTPGVALSRNVERKRAFEMLFTGDLISAEDALALGLVNRVVEPDQLDAAVDELAQSILAHSQAAIAAGKRVFYQQLEMGLSDAYQFAAEEMACNMMFRDTGEGIDAFIAKRKPTWRHE